MPRDAVPTGSAGLCPPLPTLCSIWGACVTSLPEARVTLSRLMLRLPPTPGDTGLCLETSVVHITGGILLASDRWGPGGLLAPTLPWMSGMSAVPWGQGRPAAAWSPES